MKIHLIFVLCCCFLFASMPCTVAQANENNPTIDNQLSLIPDEDIEKVETIVTTGTRTAKLLNDSPVLVEVVDGELIGKIAQGTLAQGLQYIPGVVVTRSVKDGYNVQMQGFGGDHVLVLIDGQPIISPTGSAADLDQIAVANIVQIEVIRGAASVMYGSSAMGGVINVITDGITTQQLSIEHDIGTYLDNAIQSDDINHTTKIYLQQPVQEWLTSLSAVRINDQGFDYDPETVNQNAAQVDKQFIWLTAMQDTAEQRQRFQYKYMNENKFRYVQAIPGQQQRLSYQTDVDQHQIDFGWFLDQQSQQPWQVNLRYINHQETSGRSNSIRESSIVLGELALQKIWSFADFELVTGAEVHVDQLDQIKPETQVVEIDDQQRQSMEVFAQANWRIQDHQVLLGVRSQYDSDFSWHQAVRLSAMKNLDWQEYQLQWRLGVGQSYRVPNLKERYYLFDHSGLGYMVLGNPELLPETADSWQSSLTVDTQLADGKFTWHADLNLHYTKMKDIIVNEIDSESSQQSGIDFYQYQNIAQANLSGFDLTQALRTDLWQIQLSYSYLDTETEQQPLTSRPRHQLKLNINLDIPDHEMELIAYGVYQAHEAVSDDYVGVLNNEYLTVNLVLERQLAEHLKWRIGLNNLFDEHQDPSARSRQLFDARPVSSRQLMLGISYQM